MTPAGGLIRVGVLIELEIFMFFLGGDT